MKKIVSVAFASTAALALSACGTAEDASADAEAENVEMTAEEGVEGVEEAPTEDAMAGGEAAAEEATTEEASEAVAEEAESAASEAESAAADALAAAEGAAKEEGAKMVDKAVDAAKKELTN